MMTYYVGNLWTGTKRFSIVSMIVDVVVLIDRAYSV
jgi:hypothetical protein